MSNTLPKQPEEIDNANAAQLFFDELMQLVDGDLSQIVRSFNFDTLTDLMKLQNAMLRGVWIEAYAANSLAVQALRQLQSADRWLRYVAEYDVDGNLVKDAETRIQPNTSGVTLSPATRECLEDIVSLRAFGGALLAAGHRESDPQAKLMWKCRAEFLDLMKSAAMRVLSGWGGTAQDLQMCLVGVLLHKDDIQTALQAQLDHARPDDAEREMWNGALERIQRMGVQADAALDEPPPQHLREPADEPVAADHAPSP